MKNKKFIISFLISVALFAATALLFPWQNNERVWHALLINFLFFISLAGGLSVWPAIVVATYGKWMDSAERFCRTGLAFSVPGLIILVVLWIGSETWAPWLHHHKEMFWLNNSFLFVRNLIMQVVFWVMAFWFVKKRYSRNIRTIARWLILAFVVSYSLLGFDFVMALEPEWYSMMTGGYFFISAVYTAVAAWALMAVIGGERRTNILHDLGKLTIAFCMFTSYLMFSNLLPIWYANIPHETIFLVPRMNYKWEWISYLLLVMIYLGPILLLLPAVVKRRPLLLGLVAGMILTGMWIEKWWIVSAVFNWNEIIIGLPELLLLLAFAFLFIAGGYMVKSFYVGNVEPEKSIE